MTLLNMFQLDLMYAVYGAAAIFAACVTAWWLQKKDDEARMEKIRVRAEVLKDNLSKRKDRS